MPRISRHRSSRSFLLTALATGFVAGGFGLAESARAQVTLSAVMTADDSFTAYISNSPTLQGSSFLSGASIFSVFSGSVVLPDAGTYYLHVIAVDQGAQRMLVGDFTLSSASATFANGTQSLSTNAVAWTVSDTGLGLNAVAPSIQANGWGQFNGITPTAQYIWHPSQPATAYFSTPIVVIPAAPTAGIAMATMLLTSRRRRSTN